MTKPSWHLEDPRPIAESSPYTFFRPSETECLAVRPGDLAKLIFIYDVPTDEWTAERMWVHVTEAAREGFAGTLGNDPYEPKAPLKQGDLVSFQQYHTIDIEFDKPDTAPAPVPHRTYWDRCFVEQCVLDGQEPVEFVYRETPRPHQDDDTYHDSGWRIRGRRGLATDEEYGAREFVYIALGKVLNEDDSWLHQIDAPVGSEFEREVTTGDYVRRA